MCAASNPEEEVVVFRKPLRTQKRLRQKSKVSEVSDSEVETDPVTESRKRKGARGGISASSKKHSSNNVSGTSVTYEKSSGALYEREDDHDQDEWEKETEPLTGTEAEVADNIYRGIKNYRDPLNDSKKASRIQFGPKKGAANIKVSCRFDYQPDICKDYKETGYCGYGDSCVFLHDRGDYKTGWQLEREWEESQRKAEEEEEELLVESEKVKKKSELPFACFICRNPFQNPFKTKCGHYFCQKCITDWSRKSKRCYTCGALTDSVILPVNEILSTSR